MRRIATMAVVAAGFLFPATSGFSAGRAATPLDVHAVNWSAVTLPAVCGGSQPIKLHSEGSPPVPIAIGYVTPIPKRWSSDDFEGRHSVQVWAGWDRVIYGDLGGDAGQVAALDFSCTNGGGTADGELLNGYVIFSGEGGRLSVVGVVTPQAKHPPSDPAATVAITIAPGTITAQEFWKLYNEQPPYKDLYSDGTYYSATTVWTYSDGRLRAGTPAVVKVCIATLNPASGASRLRCHHP
jgi:hypothetical protein